MLRKLEKSLAIPGIKPWTLDRPARSLLAMVTEICRLQFSILKGRPHYSCSCYSLYTLRVNIRILTRRSLPSNWSSLDEDLRAQVKARRVSRRAQAWRAPARARVMWTHLKELVSFVLIKRMVKSHSSMLCWINSSVSIMQQLALDGIKACHTILNRLHIFCTKILWQLSENIILNNNKNTIQL
jgi:hypothetical protein